MLTKKESIDIHAGRIEPEESPEVRLVNLMKAEGVFDSFQAPVKDVEEALRLGVTAKEMIEKERDELRMSLSSKVKECRQLDQKLRE